MDLTVEEILTIMKEFFEGIDHEHEKLLEELNTKELEQQDLLHILELNNLNAVEIMKVATSLKATRKERRIIKNDIERINLIRNFTNKYNNKFIGNEIKMLLKELNKLKYIQKNRKYKFRILKDSKEEKTREAEEVK